MNRDQSQFYFPFSVAPRGVFLPLPETSVENMSKDKSHLYFLFSVAQTGEFLPLPDISLFPCQQGWCVFVFLCKKKHIIFTYTYLDHMCVVFTVF